ncbi:hypothetical protein Tco_0232266, partial [Tanacetum coccineum]
LVRGLEAKGMSHNDVLEPAMVAEPKKKQDAEAQVVWQNQKTNEAAKILQHEIFKVHSVDQLCQDPKHYDLIPTGSGDNVSLWHVRRSVERGAEWGWALGDDESSGKTVTEGCILKSSFKATKVIPSFPGNSIFRKSFQFRVWKGEFHPKSEQLVVPNTPVEIEVPKELPKVVKDRITPTAITEGGWGFEHIKKVILTEVIPFINSLRESFKDFDNGLHNELNEVKTVFNQMEAAVE